MPSRRAQSVQEHSPPSQTQGESVLIAVATTSAVFLCLTLYACFTKSGFTGYGP